MTQTRPQRSVQPTILPRLMWGASLAILGSSGQQ